MSLLRVLRNAQYRRSALLAVAVAVFQQLSGINTVIFYSTGILSTCGVASPIYATVLVGAVNVLFTVVSAYLVDSAGRKSLLVLSHAGCGASLAVLTGAIYSQGASLRHATRLLARCMRLCRGLRGCGEAPPVSCRDSHAWLCRIGEGGRDKCAGAAGLRSKLCSGMWASAIHVRWRDPSTGDQGPRCISCNGCQLGGQQHRDSNFSAASHTHRAMAYLCWICPAQSGGSSSVRCRHARD